MSEFKRFYAQEHCVESQEPVPIMITTEDTQRQGTHVHPSDGIIVQYYTGTHSSYFVCVLDFEDWGSESCPRFTWYRRARVEMVEVKTGPGEWDVESTLRIHWLQASDPSSDFDYNDVREHD